MGITFDYHNEIGSIANSMNLLTDAVVDLSGAVNSIDITLTQILNEAADVPVQLSAIQQMLDCIDESIKDR